MLSPGNLEVGPEVTPWCFEPRASQLGAIRWACLATCTLRLVDQPRTGQGNAQRGADASAVPSAPGLCTHVRETPFGLGLVHWGP